MEKEKKQIKISLWAFYVLMAGIVILIGAVIIGGIGIKKQMDNLEQGQASLTNQVTPEQNNEISNVQNKVENVSQNDVNVKENNLKDVTLDDKDVQKCLEYLRISNTGLDTLLSDDNILASLYYEARSNNNCLTTKNISNDLILSIAVNYVYAKLNNSESQNVEDKKQFSAEEIDQYIETIFGKNISYKHQNFKNGIQFSQEFPTFNMAKYNLSLKNYTIDEIVGDMEHNSVINLYIKNAKIQKGNDSVVLQFPVAFEIENGTIDYYRVDYYKDLDISTETEYRDIEKMVKNLIAHNYGETMNYDINGEIVEQENIEKLKQELTVNDGLGTIEENIDKLHKIKMTFTKDDTNEYHFESFEIID